MGKTTQTTELEKAIYHATHKQGVFCCFEVTIGWNGKERVDYLTYDTNDIWRCYEIKVSKSDFNSSAKKTFVGHYNYFVLTKELYEVVKEDIPLHIGVYVGGRIVKKAKKQKLLVDEDILKKSLIRSLSREHSKLMQLEDKTVLTRLKNEVTKLQQDCREYSRRLIMCRNAIREICVEYGLDYGEVRKKFRDKT